VRLLAAVLALALAAAPAGAAEGEAHGGGLAALLWQALNLAILLAVLLYFARKPVIEYLEQRRTGIQESLENSSRLLADAEAKLAEWQARTERLDAELSAMRDTSRRLAEEEREQILVQARSTAERIRRDAASAIDQETRRARAALSREAAELAVELAGRILAENVGEEDQERLLDEFLERIEARSGEER